ncbi:hypothetical protein PUR36_32530, partial [Klebsiella pneumoniae]|uniref:hypothetical protein n=1 Tax=Klebsiella pneumoniae TaxID=573 RepID=UPI0023F8D8EB
EDQEIQQHIGPQTQVIDLGGKLILPAAHDSHIHIGWLAHFTRACIKFNSSIAIFLSDYAHITILATEGDLRHAEAR